MTQAEIQTETPDGVVIDDSWQVRAYQAAEALWDELTANVGPGFAEESGERCFKVLFARQALVIAQLERIAADVAEIKQWQADTKESVGGFIQGIQGNPMLASFLGG